MFKMGSSMLKLLIRCLLVVACAVALTALDTSGTTTAVSAVTAAPPTASFTYTPASPVTGQPVTFNGTSSSCPDSPCTYEWSDDGSTTRPIPPLWPLGSGQTLQFTFHEADTKYVRLVVTDAADRTATVEHNVVVGASSPPPAAPANTALPAIAGTLTAGRALTASTGTWTGSPTGYAYQWQDCNTLGEGCLNISGATASSYTLDASDVGHTIRVVVTATNSGGSTRATSAQTATVAAASGGGDCTTTISSVSQINAALTPGAVVCLAAGTYGAVSITTSPASNATLTAAPGAHVVVDGVNIAGSNLTVSQLHSTGTINVGSGSPYPGFSHDIIEHNDVGPTNGFGISVLSSTSTPSSYITIAYNRIHNTSDTSEGDALRFDGWNHLTVTGNDIYDIKECPSSTCHTDTLQSYNSDVPTTGLTITKNYTHDNVGAQGLPFLKDGDISNVLISDNLSVRNTNTDGQVTGIWVDENIVGLTITKNTYQDTSGSIVQADGAATGPTVAINHNVFDSLNVRPGTGPSYTTTEDYDIFTGNDEYTFGLGPHSVLNPNPGFVDTATDDYRLADNPNGIGIDWSPTEEQYGPTN
jgi:hypothetical protein